MAWFIENRLPAAFILGAALIAAPLSFSAPAHAQSAVPARAPDPTIVRMQERLDQLEVQIRTLTGDNERLRFELGQSRDRLDRLERRLGDVLTTQEGFSANTPAAQAPAPAVARPAPAATPAATPAAVAAAPAVSEAAIQFDGAKAQLDAGNFPEAEQAFAKYLDVYPQDARRPDGLYWHGRTLLARGAHREAAQRFFEVYRNYPRAGVAPEALVQLGVSLARMGEKGRACQAFADLGTAYPRASATTKALAAREAQAARCTA